MYQAVIKYQVATYSGEVTIFFDDPNTEDSVLIAKAKKLLSKKVPLPYGTQSFRVVNRE